MLCGSEPLGGEGLPLVLDSSSVLRLCTPYGVQGSGYKGLIKFPPGPLCVYLSSIVAIKPVDVPGALNPFRK